MDRRRILFISGSMAATLTIAAIMLAIVKFSGSEPPPVLGDAPEFSLTNSEGKKFASERLDRKVWVANFVFTSCKMSCPMLTREMKFLRKRFRRHAARDLLESVSISTDPKNDTPHALAKYTAENRINTKNWHFLTAGGKKEVQDLLAKGFKIGFDGDPIYHSDRFVLVDQDSKIRGYYEANDRSALKKLARDVEYLLDHPK